MKVKSQGPTFEVQEYNFSEAQEGSSDNFKSRSDLYVAYGKDKNFSYEKALKLYSKVRKISDKEVSLVTIKYHAKNTLNLAKTTQNIV